MEEFIVRHWLTVAFGAIAAFFAAIYAKATRNSSALSNGMRDILRVHIYESCDHYEEKGHMPIYARENVESMLTNYQKLGGNGTCVVRVEEVLNKLPHSPPKDIGGKQNG